MLWLSCYTSVLHLCLRFAFIVTIVQPIRRVYDASSTSSLLRGGGVLLTYMLLQRIATGSCLSSFNNNNKRISSNTLKLRQFELDVGFQPYHPPSDNSREVKSARPPSAQGPHFETTYDMWNRSLCIIYVYIYIYIYMYIYNNRIYRYSLTNRF